MQSPTDAFAPLPPCAAAPDLMFPTREAEHVTGGPTPGERLALAVCAGCPTRDACRRVVLALALPYGVAGGMTAAERRAARRRQRDLEATA